MSGFQLLRFPCTLLQEGNQLEGERFNPVRQLILVAQDHGKPSEHGERGQGDFSSRASFLTWPAKPDASPAGLQTDSAAKSGNSLRNHLSETEVSNPHRNRVTADQNSQKGKKKEKKKEHFATTMLNNLHFSFQSQLSPGSLRPCARDTTELGAEVPTASK